MHDPLTLICTISLPEFIHRDFPLVSIWHVDPETDGSDDSCGWFSPRLTKEDFAFIDELIDDPDSYWQRIFVRRPNQSDENFLDECKQNLAYLFQAFGGHKRPWWKHPKFHFWHYRFQIHFLQDLKRWLFSRCQKCGKGFSWKYCPIGNWNGSGPMWFRSENVWHHECGERFRAENVWRHECGEQNKFSNK